MKLPLSASAFPSLVVLPEVGSTNDEVARLAREDAASDFTVVVTGSQTAGRGRLGRDWVAPPGATLAISVLVRPTLPHGEPLAIEAFGWLPLIAGVAMSDAVGAALPGGEIGLKWPNDVLVDGLKVCGILTELQAAPFGSGAAVVVGAGVNLGMTREQLPVPTATSLALAGAALSGDELADLVLSRYLTGLRALTREFIGLGGDPEGSGIRSLVTESCLTLGRDVRLHLPGGRDLTGVAIGIDRSGRLVVRSSADGSETAVAAGDVTHLRYE